MHFISQMLMLSTSASITAFRLKCYDDLPEPSLFHLWLTTLVFRKVQVLDIEIYKRQASIPKCSLSKYLSWTSLGVLKLKGNQIVFKTSESVFFPNLKVLNLKRLDIQSLSQTYCFSEECYPLLEDLRLEEVTFQKNHDHKPLLHISSSTLIKLITNYLDKYLSQMDVDTPNLEYLELRMFGACPEMQTNTCNLESIVSVCFKQLDLGGQRFTKWFSKVNNVKELDVLGAAAEGLVDCDPLPEFPNLTHLKICTLAGESVWDVLQHSPNLEVLHILSSVVENVRYTFDTCCPFPENVPPCFGRTLREICIGKSGDCDKEIEALKLILQHGVVLQNLNVYACNAWTLPIAKRLLKQKRGSTNCEVELL